MGDSEQFRLVSISLTDYCKGIRCSCCYCQISKRDLTQADLALLSGKRNNSIRDELSRMSLIGSATVRARIATYIIILIYILSY